MAAPACSTLPVLCHPPLPRTPRQAVPTVLMVDNGVHSLKRLVLWAGGSDRARREGNAERAQSMHGGQSQAPCLRVFRRCRVFESQVAQRSGHGRNVLVRPGILRYYQGTRQTTNVLFCFTILWQFCFPILMTMLCVIRTGTVYLKPKQKVRLWSSQQKLGLTSCQSVRPLFWDPFCSPL